MKNKKNTFKAILLVLGWLAFLPEMQGVVPPPDGCYPNLTTAEGCNALQNLTTGTGNTALGWNALFGTSTGSFNTSVGAGALFITTKIPIRQWARQPFCSTPRAQKTALLEQALWSITTTVPIIRLSALSRCLTTLKEATILQWATRRFKIALAISTPLWALEPVPTQASAATISILAIRVSLR
jgi:hypothetical protein